MREILKSEYTVFAPETGTILYIGEDINSYVAEYNHDVYLAIKEHGADPNDNQFFDCYLRINKDMFLPYELDKEDIVLKFPEYGNTIEKLVGINGYTCRCIHTISTAKTFNLRWYFGESIRIDEREHVPINLIEENHWVSVGLSFNTENEQMRQKYQEQRMYPELICNLVGSLVKKLGIKPNNIMASLQHYFFPEEHMQYFLVPMDEYAVEHMQSFYRNKNGISITHNFDFNAYMNNVYKDDIKSSKIKGEVK